MPLTLYFIVDRQKFHLRCINYQRFLFTEPFKNLKKYINERHRGKLYQRVNNFVKNKFQKNLNIFNRAIGVPRALTMATDKINCPNTYCKEVCCRKRSYDEFLYFDAM